MATEYPPLGKSFVLSYANNDRDFPVIGIRKDPRVDNYKIPEDLSPHPDSKRYPSHVFTGAQPTNSDERVQWVYEILPAPWVPFTRYDNDLGPIQGRRRSVKNEGQKASLTSSTKISYEGRDGSAIVSNEIEETWSILVDEDGNSLFPIKDRDFYDPSKGAVQERRQLFVPTGEEVGTLENIDGVITQKSYEPYNEYLSISIVQTYSVDGPQLIGKTTNNEGQLLTTTTQRKAALNYVPPNLSATKTVEVAREDYESLVERIVDAPNVFDKLTLSAQKPDTIPEKFRVNAPVKRTESVIEQTNVEQPILSDTEYLKTEQRLTEFTVQKSTTEREDDFNETQSQRLEEGWGINIPYKEYISETIPSSPTIEAEGLDDKYHLIREYDADQIEDILSSYSVSIPTSIDLDLPKVLTHVGFEWQPETSLSESETNLGDFIGSFTSITHEDGGEISSTLSLIPQITFNFKDIWGKNLPATTHLFFLKKENLTNSSIKQKVGVELDWPVFQPRAHSYIAYGKSETKTFQVYLSRSVEVNSTPTGYFIQPKFKKETKFSSSLIPISINIPPCLTGGWLINQPETLSVESGKIISIRFQSITLNVKGTTVLCPEYKVEYPVSHAIKAKFNLAIPATNYSNIPSSGIYLMNSSIEPYKFGWFLVRATTLDASILS